MATINFNEELFNELKSDKNKALLVEFYAPWCGYCRRIAPAFDKIAEEYEQILIAGKLNIDDYERLSDDENIDIIPTLVLYKDGAVIDTIVNPSSKDAINKFIEKNLDVING